MLNKIKDFLKTAFLEEWQKEYLSKRLPKLREKIVLIEKTWTDVKDLQEFKITDFLSLREFIEDIEKVKLKEEKKKETEKALEEKRKDIEKNLLDKYKLKETDLKLTTTWQELAAVIKQNWLLEWEKDKDKKEEKKKKITDDENLNAMSTAIRAFIYEMISKAVSLNASDIHIEPKLYADWDKEKVYWRVRFRENWDLYDKTEFSFKEDQIPFRTILWEICKLWWANSDKAKDVPLDFKIDFVYENPDKTYKLIDLRVATMPTDRWLSQVVIRILWNFVPPDITKLWLRKTQLDDFIKAVKSNEWFILVVWPTWSWKSSTQTSVLRYLSQDTTLKIISWENPIENKENAIVQSALVTQQFSDKKDNEIYDNKKFLKATLRSDVDQVVLQEVRDKQEADLAIEAALTWALVLWTYHANSSALTVTRMIASWVQRILLSSSLKLIVSQRLIKKPCPHCCLKEKFNERQIEAIKKNFEWNVESLKEEWLSLENLEDFEYTKINKQWCEQCKNRWIVWRQWVFEVMLFNRWLLETLSKEQTTYIDLENYAIKNNWMETLAQDALIRILKWEADYEDADWTFNFELI